MLHKKELYFQVILPQRLPDQGTFDPVNANGWLGPQRRGCVASI